MSLLNKYEIVKFKIQSETKFALENHIKFIKKCDVIYKLFDKISVHNSLLNAPVIISYY